MMISFWKPIISISLFLTLTVLAADEFILEEDGIIQIECGDDDPASICGLNGEVENQRSYAPEGTYTVTHGNGVCIGCDTNQPADLVTCEEAATCTCIKCETVTVSSAGVVCNNSTGACDMVSGASATVSTLTYGVLMVAGALLL